jgi:hypothetical protein
VLLLARRVLLLGAFALALAGDARAVPLVFEDGVFADSDWNVTSFVFGTGGSVAASQVASGGNPAEYRQIVDTVALPAPGAFSAVWAFHRHVPSIYDPAASGAIEQIDYSEDARALPGASGDGQATGPALRQGGHVYVVGGLVTTSGQDWHAIARAGLGAQDFVLVADDLVDGSQHPDFSVSGGPLELGFVRANSTSVGGTSGYVLGAAIDNWRMVITPVPEPAALLLAAGGALLLGVRRARAR